MNEDIDRIPSLLRLGAALEQGGNPLPSDISCKPPQPAAPSRQIRLALDPETVRDTLGPSPDPHDLAMLTLDVLAGVCWLEAEIRTSRIGRARLRVRGRPLADWLEVAEIARLLRDGKAAAPPLPPHHDHRDPHDGGPYD
jgi:hypothetical protein